MSSVRKYVLKPFETDEQGEKVDKPHGDHTYAMPANENVKQQPAKLKRGKNIIKERAKLKMENVLKILASIALVNGYDNQRRIRSANGKFVSDTDVVQLIMHAMQPGKILTGEDEFVNLLREAKVDPNWLFNENIKSKLKPSQSEQPKIIKHVGVDPTMYVEKTSPLQDKSKRSKDRVNNVENKKPKLNWDYSDDE